MAKCKNCWSQALNDAPETGLCDVCYQKDKVVTLREALDYVIRDLEMRSNLKRGEDKGLVDIGDGAYQQAKAALAATEV